MSQGFWRSLVLCISLAFCGCGNPPQAAKESTQNPVPKSADTFEGSATGGLKGVVHWEGKIPIVDQFHTRPNILAGPVLQQKQVRANPNQPRIDPATGALAGAVVYLEGVDPLRAKPWNHGPITVEQRDYQFHIMQDQKSANIGFVHVGDDISLVSRDPRLHMLHASGVAFFSLAFPDPDMPLERRLNEKGLVELTSGCGYYWMRAYLFVSDHPYWARSDEQGAFQLDEVAPGDYQVVCWLPNWKEARHEREPESGNVFRLFFQPPIQISKPVHVQRGLSQQVDFAIAAP
jgi:hypothetical protein